MRLLFAGTPAVALPSLDALLASDRHDVVAVLTRPDAPAGRGRKLAASPIRQRAEQAGIEILTPRRAGDPEFLDRLAAIAPDCCPVIAYGGLIPQSALEIPECGWVNLHFSILPAWRGAAPVQRAIIAGDDVTGATTFQLEAGLDTGPVYGVLTVTIGARETAGELLDRLAVDGADLLTATLDGIDEGSLSPVPQPEDGVSSAPKLSVEEAHVDWSRSAIAVDRQIRGCTPAPGAWTTFRNKRLRLGPVIPLAEDAGLVPGELAILTHGVVLGGTGTGPVRLEQVRPEGRGDMTAADWARGVRLEPGDRLGAE